MLSALENRPLAAVETVAQPVMEETANAVVLNAEFDVDWERMHVTITAAAPDTEEGAAALEYRLAVPNSAPEGPMPQVEFENGRLRLECEAATLRRIVVPDTRSLWFVEKVSERIRYLRIDLPTPVIRGASTSMQSDRPRLTLRLEGLMPDFSVAHVHGDAAAAEDDSGLLFGMAESPIAADGFGNPRIVDVAQGDDLKHVVIEFDPLSGGGHRAHWITAVNGDGSRSGTLAVKQGEDGFERGAARVASALPLPVDAWVRVPRVELLPLDEAVDRIAAAGCIAIAFDAQRMMRLKADEWKQATVQRQGLPGRTWCRTGEWILLGINAGNHRATYIDRDALDEALLVEPRTALDVDDDFGFVDFRPLPRGVSGALTGSDGDAASNSATDEIAIYRDDLFSEPDPSVEVEAGASGLDEGDDEVAVATDASATVPIDVSPGINLSPGDAEGTFRRALLKSALPAIDVAVDHESSLGVLGNAFFATLAEHEEAVVRSMEAGGTLESVDVTSIFEDVATRLDVPVDQQELQSAQEAWQQHAAQAIGHSRVDDGENRLVTNKVVVWFIEWLVRAGHYDPAVHVQVARDDSGASVARFQSVATSPEWKTAARLPDSLRRLLDKDAAARPATSGSDAGDGDDEPGGEIETADTEIRIPMGEALVTESAVPDRVRIPEGLNGSLARQAISSIREVGLRVARDGKLFAKDRVVASRPEQGSWIDPQEAISLEVRRRVPDLTEGDARTAADALEDRELVPTVGGEGPKYRNSDRVVEQDPPAGEYVERNARVALTLMREVPRVVDLRADAAAKLLSRRGFNSLGPDVTLPTDIVAEQQPKPGDLAAPGGDVTLTRIETRVPDLQGSSLTAAETLVEAKQKLDEQRLRMEIVEPKTTYPRAKILRQSPAAGTRIDRAEKAVKVLLVVPIPEFSQSTRLDDAVAQVRSRSLTAEPHSSRARDDDYVMRVRVADQQARRYRSRRTTYVQPGEQLELTVGRKVPSVAGESWAVGLDAINDVGLRVSTPNGTGTHVESTRPQGNSLVAIDDRVVVYAGLQIPDVRGDRFADARRRLKNLGLRVESLGPERVETENSSLIGQTYVEDSPRAQNPRPGRIVRKGSSARVALRTIVYVRPQVTVPNVVGILPDEAQSRLAANKLRMRSTIVTQITKNPALDGQTTVIEQNPQAGRRVERDSVVQVRARTWRYSEPGFKTFALFPQRDVRTMGVTWTCQISDDRKSVLIDVYFANGDSRRASGQLTDDRFVFLNERCLTYRLTGLEQGAVGAVRIPTDGEGRGQLYVDGVWFYGESSQEILRFTTKPPRR